MSRAVVAQFGVRFDYDPTSRMFDPALGGGALLDLGVYPFSFAAMILGSPWRSQRPRTSARPGSTPRQR